MKNIPIIGKLLTIIAVLGIFVIGVAIYTTGQMRAVDARYTAMVDHQWAPALRLSRSASALQHVRAALGNLAAVHAPAGDAAALHEIEEYRGRFSSFMETAAAESPPEYAETIRSLRAGGLDVVDRACGPSLAAAKGAVSAADIAATNAVFLRDCAPRFTTAASGVSQQIDRMEHSAQAVDQELAVQAKSAILVTYLVIAGGLALVVAVVFLGARAWITAPLGGLNGVMIKLAGGDLTASVTGADRRDEVGSMAKTVQVFKDAAVMNVQLEKDAAAQRAAIEADRVRQEAEREQAAKQQAFVVESLASGLSILSSGDLMFRLDQPFAPEYEKLRNDFNAAMEKLQGTMTVIAGNAQGIRSGGDEISTAADDLSRRTEQQAASLEETAAALDQITATVRRTAQGATEANTVVSAARTDAEHSGEVVRQAVDAMSAIETSSNQIGQIIGVIDEIAFQTNLLALNAGVEAARAGDAGRGFAVVASEVRALAQRSADAAKEIKALILTSSQHVNAGVGLVGETGKSLERIVRQVAQINTLVTEIAASAQEQSAGLAEVNTAVNQMDQVTQQNAAMVEQSTAASHALAQEAGELTRLVSQFKVGGEHDAVMRAAPARRPSAPPSVTRTAMKTIGRGGAVLKPSAAPSDESWEEF